MVAVGMQQPFPDAVFPVQATALPRQPWSNATRGAVEDALTQVSWQSAFWVIVPLALNSMSQPSGRVCGSEPRQRTFWRSSPIFCAFDALSMLIKLFIYTCTGTPLTTAILATVSARFDCIYRNDQALERLSSLRWFLFVLGTLPQAVKLLAFRGIPWTQAWSGMYLTSFIIIEALLAAKAIIHSATAVPAGPEHQNLLRDDATSADDDDSAEETLSLRSVLAEHGHLPLVDESCFALALVIQEAFLVWAFHQLRRPLLDPTLHLLWHLPTPVLFLATALLVPCLFTLVFYLLLLLLGRFLSLFNWADFIGLELTAAYVSLFLTSLIMWRCMILSVALSGTIPDLSWSDNAFLFCGSACVLLGSTYLLAFLTDPFFRFLGESFQGWKSSAPVLLAKIIILSIMWYDFRYVPNGTHRPPWTNKLG